MKDPVRDVLAALTESLITPTVAKTGELDEFVNGVKMGVVQHLAKHSDAAKDILARHFGKSDRWVYRMLSEFKSYLEDQSSESQLGRRQIMSDLLFYVQTHYPEGVGVAECRRLLGDKGWRLSEPDVAGLLSLYVDMGLLELVEPSRGGALRGEGDKGSHLKRSAATLLYRSPQVTNRPVVDSDIYRDRLDMIRDRLGSLTPILVAYVRGEPGATLGIDRASVLPQHYEQAATDIRRFAVRRVQEAVLATLEEDPDERQERIEFCALSVVGRSS